MKKMLGIPATLVLTLGMLAAPALASGMHNPCNPCAMKHNPCNPCAAKKTNPCNPCAMKHNPCNPCAAKKTNPCNPCSLKKKMNPCNPCAMKHNPCNPCAAKKMNPCNPCSMKQGKQSKEQWGTPGNTPIREHAFDNFQQAVALGEKMWNDPKLGTSGLACMSCHADYALLNLDKNQNYPHFVNMVGDVVTLDQMINYCMINPMKGKQFEKNSKELTAMAAFFRAYRMKYLREHRK